jgi:5S rRNA maturation endonuclease (ribonuclease M5)
MSRGIDALTKKEQLDELEKLLDRLRAASEQFPVLVEGARDVAALRKLGLEGDIQKLNRGEGLVARADALSHRYKHIILLTDWDYKGVELHDRLKSLLQDAQVRTDDFFWSRLRKLVGGGSRTVEDLPAFLEILRERASSNC